MVKTGVILALKNFLQTRYIVGSKWRCLIFLKPIRNLFAQVNFAVSTSRKQERLAVWLMIIVCKKLESTKQSFRHVGVNPTHCDVICLQTQRQVTKGCHIYQVFLLNSSFLCLFILQYCVLYICHDTSKTRVIIRLIVSCIVISAYFKAMLVTAVLAFEQAHLREFRGKIILAAEPFFSRDDGSAAIYFPWTWISEPARRLLLFSWKWNLETILLNNETLSLVNTKFQM